FRVLFQELTPSARFSKLQSLVMLNVGYPGRVCAFAPRKIHGQALRVLERWPTISRRHNQSIVFVSGAYRILDFLTKGTKRLAPLSKAMTKITQVNILFVLVTLRFPMRQNYGITVGFRRAPWFQSMDHQIDQALTASRQQTSYFLEFLQAEG